MRWSIQPRIRSGRQLNPERAPTYEPGQAASLGGNRQVLFDAEVLEEIGDLEGPPESFLGLPVRRRVGHVCPEEVYPSLGRVHLPGDGSEERGLARSVGADDGPALTPVDPK